tara:strand:+ start:757 stop:1359 length:603 start_codon:yes stop_codon:yes gene_type:complete
MVSVQVPTHINVLKKDIDKKEIKLSNYSTEIKIESLNLNSKSLIEIEDYFTGLIIINNVRAEYKSLDFGSYKSEKTLVLEYLQDGLNKASGTCDIILKVDKDFKLFHIPIKIGIVKGQEDEKSINDEYLLHKNYKLEYIIYIKPRDIYLKFIEIYKQMEFIYRSNQKNGLENTDIDIMYHNYNKSRLQIQNLMLEKFHKH